MLTTLVVVAVICAPSALYYGWREWLAWRDHTLGVSAAGTPARDEGCGDDPVTGQSLTVATARVMRPLGQTRLVSTDHNQKYIGAA